MIEIFGFNGYVGDDCAHNYKIWRHVEGFYNKLIFGVYRGKYILQLENDESVKDLIKTQYFDDIKKYMDVNYPNTRTIKVPLSQLKFVD